MEYHMQKLFLFFSIWAINSTTCHSTPESIAVLKRIPETRIFYGIAASTVASCAGISAFLYTLPVALKLGMSAKLVGDTKMLKIVPLIPFIAAGFSTLVTNVGTYYVLKGAAKVLTK